MTADEGTRRAGVERKQGEGERGDGTASDLPPLLIEIVRISTGERMRLVEVTDPRAGICRSFNEHGPRLVDAMVARPLNQARPPAASLVRADDPSKSE